MKRRIANFAGITAMMAAMVVGGASSAQAAPYCGQTYGSNYAWGYCDARAGATSGSVSSAL